MILTDYCMDVRHLPLFEDSIRGQYFRRRIHTALGDRPVIVYSSDVLLSYLLVPTLLSLVSPFSINIVDLGCPQKGQSNGALTRWPSVGRKKGVSHGTLNSLRVRLSLF
jgi:hypothetical protein